ncbi:hypothetical protein DLM46_23140 [Paraburkholderia lacunae]|uniref:Uncharacterized protein n=1 Tax=Paraburkholderia lacunae TaxID=2211104 RepID=A0A370N4J9_9BURK|nr:hypothetical protein DLM46_23140 [Paraburkholderia lacunae]
MSRQVSPNCNTNVRGELPPRPKNGRKPLYDKGITVRSEQR